MTSVRIRVLFFGVLRDIVGVREDSLTIAEGGRVETVFEHYATLHPRLREMAKSVVLALNQQFSAPGAALSDGDEVAFLPPVSGGSGLADSAFMQQISDPAGHFSRSLGLRLMPGHWSTACSVEKTVPSLRLKELRGIIPRVGVRGIWNTSVTKQWRFRPWRRSAAKLRRRWRLAGLACIHRLGKLEVGEASVVVVATSPHRKLAFDAAFEGINRLKRTVPIWKKEFFDDGEVWVEGEWDDSVTKAGA